MSQVRSTTVRWPVPRPLAAWLLLRGAGLGDPGGLSSRVATEMAVWRAASVTDTAAVGWRLDELDVCMAAEEASEWSDADFPLADGGPVGSVLAGQTGEVEARARRQLLELSGAGLVGFHHALRRHRRSAVAASVSGWASVGVWAGWAQPPRRVVLISDVVPTVPSRPPMDRLSATWRPPLVMAQWMQDRADDTDATQGLTARTRVEMSLWKRVQTHDLKAAGKTDAELDVFARSLRTGPISDEDPAWAASVLAVDLMERVDIATDQISALPMSTAIALLHAVIAKRGGVEVDPALIPEGMDIPADGPVVTAAERRRQRDEHIRQMRAAGISVKQIMEETHLARPTVYKVLSEG
ncbi:helix-turn-helix domain-containing protein [Propionibacterium freudenreichii]|uniref:helix-turn-helix domain-containing protein n=1 Tax=Propionibacterium freudenreichii TaxID=1744 RepID=UPI00254E6122|nr:helix-turn-helix domain-containing protein [Propionibacterium freudenreichii]MDK9354269.1 helix-turn-helix domain-containing protein [Propionibacterium freudenreichii]MDK9621893.1 helix-turn-helix domain-containing protein [Propionibacterium freudenreichii]